MNSLGDIFKSLGELALYRSISNYIDARINFFTESTLASVFTTVGFFALILLTLWIMWYGYQIVMGNSQHSAKEFVFKAVRAWIIIAFATGLAASMGFSIRATTTNLSDMISSTMTGSNDASKCTSTDSDKGFMGCKIDQNLIRAQASMAFVGQLDTGGDPVLEDKKSKASLMAAAGIGGPAIVAGALLLTLKVAMALFIALGPIFIMCLLFKVTTPLFQKWLYYGISTMFATAMLAAVSDISMDLVENISGSLFVSNIFTSLAEGSGFTSAASTASGGAAGIMQASMQQLGLGLMLSTLLISTPPMAAQFFNGVMGSFSSYNHLASVGIPAPGMPPMSSYGGGATGAAGARGADGAAAPGATNTGASSVDASPRNVSAQQYLPQTNVSVNQDVIKPSSDIGNASKGFASNELAQADKSVKDQAVKLSLILVSGALVWASGGVQEAQAQVCGDGGQYAPDNINGVVTPVCIGGSAGNRIYGTHPYDGYGPPPPANNTAPPPVIQKPSSYGAVAWDLEKGYVGTAIHQASKQAAIDMAMQRCGTDNCEIIREYANQCMAIVYGAQLKGSKSKSFLRAGLTKNTAEKNALAACHKGARDCKIFVSECSLP